MRLIEAEKTFLGELIDESPSWAGLSVLDLSAGTGLLGICAAAKGARARCVDIGPQLPLLRANLEISAGLIEDEAKSGVVEAGEYWWGGEVDGLKPSWWPADAADRTPMYDIVLVSDALFISLRDDMEELLHAALVHVASISRVVVFGFEERIGGREQEFMDRLAKDLDVREITDKFELDFADVQNVEGADSADLFWEDPPVRLFRVQRPAE